MNITFNAFCEIREAEVRARLLGQRSSLVQVGPSVGFYQHLSGALTGLGGAKERTSHARQTVPSAYSAYRRPTKSGILRTLRMTGIQAARTLGCAQSTLYAYRKKFAQARGDQ